MITVPNITISDVMQIAILFIVIYSILKHAKGSRFGQVLMGIGILVSLALLFTFLFHFEVISIIIQQILIYLTLSTVVIFQPEIRRILSAVGAFGFFEKAKYDPLGAAEPEYVVKVILELSEKKMGALFAFERGISLRSYEDSGVRIDAAFSSELIRAIFTPPLPLHDGGVTIRNGRISSAHCVFPVSSNPDLNVNGMRHRAAVGLSEETDALVVVVSEETGIVAVAHDGKIFKYADNQVETALLRWVGKAMKPKQRTAKPWKKLFEHLQRR